MADASAPKPLGRSQLQVRRSVTLPTNLLASRNSPGTPPAPTPDGAETLFTYHTSRIISFSPPLTKDLLVVSKNRRDSLDEEPVGVLPWGSHTERTLSTGSLRIYKVPGSTAFLQSGRTIHAIMSKSRCWCVDGESKFVLRIRGNNYYRIELPNSTTEDKKAVAGFKIVLDRILQYETTACPFKRSFYIELPEKPDVILKPWKPKHSPITARDLEDQHTGSEAGSPIPEVVPELRVEKRSTGLLQTSPLLDNSPQDPGGEESVPIASIDGNDYRVPYVETVVSNYETLKQVQTQQENRVASSETDAPSHTYEDLDVSETADVDIPTSTIIAQNDRSQSATPDVEASTSTSVGSSNHAVDDAEVENQAPSSGKLEEGSNVDDALKPPTDAPEVELLHNEERLDGDAFPPKPRRSFTAPALHHQPTLSSASISSSEHQDEATTEGRASSSSSTKSVHAEEQLPFSPRVDEEDDDDLLNPSDPEVGSGFLPRGDEIEIARAQSEGTDSSEPGSSTPEWLELSAPSTPQRDSRSWTENADKMRNSSAEDDADESETSPRSHLRRRFQQRRELSPMPSLSVLHVPSREHPALDVAVVLFRSVCRTLLVLSMQIVVLLMSIASRQLSSKTGAGNVARSERNHSAIKSLQQSDSDSSAEDFASVISDSASEDDFGVPIESQTGEKRRASSGVRSRRKDLTSRKSIAHPTT